MTCCLSVNAQKNEGDWDIYMATYQDGPGSTVFNKSLKQGAPYSDLPYLLKAGVHFTGCSGEGLPEQERFSKLYEISDSVSAYMDRLLENRLAGTFTYQCSRTDYYYIKDTANIRKKLEAAFEEHFKGEHLIIEIKADAEWKAYLEFLYPNEETQDYMENLKVVMRLHNDGDSLKAARQVDHWAYFANELDRENFRNYVIGKGFKIEEKFKSERADFSFGLKFSRADKVDINSICIVTRDLRQQAKKFQGDYDGWETFVIQK
jgi:hypothetical protein